MGNQVIGFSVRLFMSAGDPDGLRLIEKSNWSGLGLVFPRSEFGQARQRVELQRAGVYLLWGPGSNPAFLRLYIGEGDGVLPRLEQHVRNKDFWTHAAVFVSKDQNLNKAHVKYLESRLIAIAQAANRCEMDNGNASQPASLSEADTADAEGFLADLLLCLPILGIHTFESGKVAADTAFDLVLTAKGVEARGQDGSAGFLVRKGSCAVKNEVASIQAYLHDLRAALLRNGVLIDKGQYYEFTQDYLFNSPSTAASVVLGRSENGRTAWKSAEGKSLKHIQES